MSDVAEPWVLGIDEAGRGPVLGPMVYGLCYCRKSDEKKLKKMGFADSKTLSAERRTKLFALLKKMEDVSYLVDVIGPQEMSSKMLRRTKTSLNAISHDSSIALIQKVIDQGVNITEAYIDPVGPCESYHRKLSMLFPNIKFTIESKADAKFPVVSAASVCAKVTRDVELEQWNFHEVNVKKDWSRDMGSGYPSDPNTKKWLKSTLDGVFGFPSLVRFSWSTSRKLLEERGVPCDWGDDDDETQVPESSKISNFFSSSSSPSSSSALTTPSKKRKRQVKPADRMEYFKALKMTPACFGPV